MSDLRLFPVVWAYISDLFTTADMCSFLMNLN